MNTQGWMRGIMAKNMETDKFIEHLAECLSREFEMETEVSKQEDQHVIKLGVYKNFISNEEAAALQAKGPYSLDKHILDKLLAEGFEFDKMRSQYTRYCYGLFYRDEDGCVY